MPWIWGKLYDFFGVVLFYSKFHLILWLWFSSHIHLINTISRTSLFCFWFSSYNPSNTRVPFSVYHMTLIMRAFWGIFSSNCCKFHSEIQDPKFGCDVANDAMTLRQREQWRDNDLGKYHTVRLHHAWQRQKFGRNVRIKLFSRVWNRFQWCSTNRSPNYLGF
jgi:hypothetical protein